MVQKVGINGSVPRQISPTTGIELACATPMDSKKRSSAKVGQKQLVHRKSIGTFWQRTSQYRGVTRHRWTGNMKPICGIIVGRKKDKPGKEDKVSLETQQLHSKCVL